MSMPARQQRASSIAAMPLRTLHNWPQAALEALCGEPSVVRVLVASLRGSAPREAGACMLVSSENVVGTIGGGRLEFQAIAAARRLLPSTAPVARLQRCVLGVELGQCCGGVVELWLERYTVADRTLLQTIAGAMSADRAAALVCSLESGGSLQRSLQNLGADAPASRLHLARSNSSTTLVERLDDQHPALWLFGAGHVGQALVRVMSELPLRISWIDSRAELFPLEVSDSVRVLTPASPVDSLKSAPPNACYVVMTHDHALDFALCRAILSREDVAYVGLIGSHSKAARFRSRLQRDGLSPEQIGRLVCPIGVEGIASKWPAAIAVSIAAQLLQALAVPRIQQAISINCSGAKAQGCDACQPTP